MNEELDKVKQIRDDPSFYAKTWKERTGGKVIGIFCSYVPEELIAAAGALPFRVFGSNKPVSRSGAHLQTYCCSFARTALDSTLRRELEFLDGAVFTHTCDTMQRLSDIWRLNAGFDFHADFVLPVRFGGELAWEYHLHELEGFRSRLEAFLGGIDANKLEKSIQTYNTNRGLLEELYMLKCQNPELISCEDVFSLVYTSMIMEKEEHNGILEKVVSNLKSERKNKGQKEELFGVGSIMDQWEFLRIIEDVGGTIVDDLFCNGRRYFEGQVVCNGDLLEAVGRRLWERMACPCKHGGKSFAKDLPERVKNSGAKGVIFFLLKFCDPHAFEYPHAKKMLDDCGIPSLHIEFEYGSLPAGQTRTRVEAFLETLRGRRD